MMWAAASVWCSAAMKASTAKTRATSCRVASRLSAVIVMAKGAGAHIALATRCGVPARRAIVSLERSRRTARVVENIPPGRGRPVHAPAKRLWSAMPSAVIRIAVVKGRAMRVVPVVVIDDVAVVPVKSPVRPAPTKTPEKSDSEPSSKRKIRPAIPDARIRIPSRPRHDRWPVHYPRIVRRHVDDIRRRGLDNDGRTLRRYHLLRSSLQVSRLLRLLPHRLHGIHHVLLLVVISPRNVLVHVAQHGRKRSERLHTGIPIHLVHRLRQSFIL